jgi:hypothetical protein
MTIYLEYYLAPTCIGTSEAPSSGSPNVMLMKLYVQFHQRYIGIPEDGAPNAPKHVGVR